jgi:protein-tyrosine phosphatase
VKIKDFFSYSFLEGRLIGSEAPENWGVACEVAKKFCGHNHIKHMITLTSENEDFVVEGVSRHHVPLRDMPSKRDMRRLSDIIDDALSRNESVWIHCKQGIDRTGCVIGAYLVSKGYDPDAVISELLSVFKKRFGHPRFSALWKDKIDFIRSCA